VKGWVPQFKAEDTPMDNLADESANFVDDIEEEFDFEEEIDHYEEVRAPSPPKKKIKTSSSQDAALITKGLKMDNELRQLAIRSKLLDIKYKELLIKKVERSLEVVADSDYDPLSE
jgi:hypothetical protein